MYFIARSSRRRRSGLLSYDEQAQPASTVCAPSARGGAPRDIADHIGEVLRARPHRPVACREVDPGDIPQLLEAPQPVVALLDRSLVLLGRVRRADGGARHIE